MDNRSLAKKVADHTGLPVEKCREVITQICAALERGITQNELIRIDRFGVFRPRLRGQAHPTRNLFHGDPILLDKINAPVLPELEEPVVRLPRVQRPVHPEDRELIELWLTHRAGSTQEPVTTQTIFDVGDETAPMNHWAPATCEVARQVVNSFSRFCDEPLVQLGLLPSRLAAKPLAERRTEIIAFAERYAERAAPRLEKYARSRAAMEQPVKGSLIWRTRGWIYFVKYNSLFFKWLELHGYRPPGSNPFTGIRRFHPLDFMRGRVVVVNAWYEKILAYPLLSTRDRAIIHLLSNGLRRSEVALAPLANLNLPAGTITVTGKGGHVREVLLWENTLAAVRAWLDDRRDSVNPFIFGTRRSQGRAMNPEHINNIVRQAVRCAFPSDRSAIARVSPHWFRHYYITTALERGVPAIAIMANVGHNSEHMIRRYTHPDKAWVFDQLRRADQRSPHDNL